MGSPVSPIVVNLFMERLIWTLCTQFVSWYSSVTLVPLCWWHLGQKRNGSVIRLLYAFQPGNRTHQVYAETHSGWKGRFSRLLRTRSQWWSSGNDSVQDTHTDEYLLYWYHTVLWFINWVWSEPFSHRADTMTSNDKFKQEEHGHLKSALKVCGYRDWTFHKALKPKTQHQSSDISSRNQNDSDKPVYRRNLTISYVSGLSEKLLRIFNSYQIPVSFKPTNTLRQKLVHPRTNVYQHHDSSKHSFKDVIILDREHRWYERGVNSTTSSDDISAKY